MLATFIHAARDIRLEEAPDPTLSGTGRDAIVRVVAACICGSDLWPYRVVVDTDEPHRIGHEFVGIVEAVGDSVTNVSPGDFAIAPFYDRDMTCGHRQNGVSPSCQDGNWWGRDDRVGQVGAPHGGGELPIRALFSRNVGVAGGIAPVRNHVDALPPLVLDGTIQPGRVFDCELPLAEVAEGYRLMDERAAIKVPLRP